MTMVYGPEPINTFGELGGQKLFASESPLALVAVVFQEVVEQRLSFCAD